jgi:hypothetical protein
MDVIRPGENVSLVADGPDTITIVQSPDIEGATSMVDQSGLGTDRIKHLEFIQAVVTRLGTNSFLIKGWVLTIAAAFFAVLAKNLNGTIAAVGLIPLLAFWFLDGYFLWQERLFRRLYDDARRPATRVEMLSMNVAAYRDQTTWVAAAFSQTLLLFYGALVLIDLAFIVAAVVAN